jgi:diadenosine tetraphosphate (Ap4A) HIT family hydrolase
MRSSYFGVVPQREEPQPTATRCYSCEQNALAEWPPRECIYDDGLWRIAHAFNAARVGWLVLVLRRHAESLSELTPAEAAVFGRLVPAASRALEAELGVPKAYVMFLAELEQFHHVHVHVVARPSPDLRGTKVFDLLKRPPEEWVTDDDMDAFAARITARLDEEGRD